MESRSIPSVVHSQFRMSWTAYVKPTLLLLVMLLLGSALASANIWFFSAFVLFSIGLFVFNVMTIRSLVLYTDEDGVWVYRGILPWSKGVSGVKWRDLDDAAYFPNFFSWILKSYRVRVGHRFTKTSEIVLTHIARGDAAAMHINDIHRRVLTEMTEKIA